jgi:hypothetical protein
VFTAPCDATFARNVRLHLDAPTSRWPSEARLSVSIHHVSIWVSVITLDCPFPRMTGTRMVVGNATDSRCQIIRPSQCAMTYWHAVILVPEDSLEPHKYDLNCQHAPSQQHVGITGIGICFAEGCGLWNAAQRIPRRLPFFAAI